MMALFRLFLWDSLLRVGGCTIKNNRNYEQKRRAEGDAHTARRQLQYSKGRRSTTVVVAAAVVA